MSNETQSPSSPSGNFGNQAGDDRAARVTMVSSQPLPSLTNTAPTNSGAQPAAAAGHASLHITLREGGAMERELTYLDTRLGKGPDNEIILSDAAISSNHALIRYDGTHHMLIDVGSRNGTYLNNQRVAVPTPLKAGDSIRIGHCTLAFRSVSAPVNAQAGAQPSQTVAFSGTEILSATAGAPPPPSAPPVPANVAAPTEDVLARALVNNKLIAIGDMERVQKNLQGRRLYHVLIAEKLSTELGLRDLMSRTFNMQLADLRSTEIDVPLAQKLNPAFLREKLCLPLASPAGESNVAVADPTDKAALDEIKKRISKTVNWRLATASEIAAKLDAQFTPRLIGVLPSGEKLDILINQSEIALGKAPHNRVVLNDTTVSSSHATILTRDGGYSIIDLGSSNGTFVNGTRLTTEAWTMKHGDRIQLGKVMFTFRNPTETVENKTARLSLDALEEIRKRAGLAATGAPMAAAAFAAGAAAAPVAMSEAEREAEEEKKRKKKEEKEQKEKEKSSLTSASNLSRIIAQVMGAMIAIIGPIVLFYLGVFGGGGTATNGNSGNSGSASNAATVKLTQGKWTGFSSGIFGKDPEASGAAAVPGVPGLLVVDDGRQNEIVWMPINDLGKQAGDLKAVPLNATFADAEAITYGGGYFYVMTSQSDPDSVNSKALLRFSFNAQTQTINGTAAELISDLRAFLLQNVPEIATRGAAPGLDGGLNIEGMAYDPNNERLLLGLRSPFIGSQAVLVPIKLINPLQPLALNNIKVDSPSVIPLALENQGVRDITYDAHKRVFLIISGAPETQKKTAFGLWEWSGNADDPPRKIMMLDDKYKPEGITSVTLNGQDFLMVMGDEGNYLRLDYVK